MNTARLRQQALALQQLSADILAELGPEEPKTPKRDKQQQRIDIHETNYATGRWRKPEGAKKKAKR